jgi:hypothetical protein
MAELSNDQKTKLDAVKAKVEAGDVLSADDIAFLEADHGALEGIAAEEEESD